MLKNARYLLAGSESAPGVLSGQPEASRKDEGSLALHEAPDDEGAASIRIEALFEQAEGDKQGGAEESEKAKLALLLMLFEAKRTACRAEGAPALGRQAEAAASAPAAAGDPSCKASCRASMSLNLQRFLVLRRRVEACDVDSILRETIERGDSFDEGFLGALERVCAVGALAGRSLRTHDPADAEMAASLLNAGAGGWFEMHLFNALRFALANEGFFSSDEIWQMESTLKETRRTHARAESLERVAARIPECFASAVLNLDVQCETEALIAEIEAAAAEAAGGGPSDGAAKAEALSGEAAVRDFVRRLCAVPEIHRRAAWWHAAAALLQLPGSEKAFTPKERLGILFRAQAANASEPDGTENRHEALRERFYAAAACDRASVKKLRLSAELPLAFAPSWVNALGEREGRLRALCISNFYPDFALIEADDEKGPSLWLVSTSLTAEAEEDRGRFAFPLPHVEIAMKIPRAKLSSDGTADDLLRTVFLDASFLAVDMLSSCGFIDSVMTDEKGGEPLYDGLPFVMMNVAGSGSRLAFEPLPDAEGKLVRIHPVQLFLPDEAVMASAMPCGLFEAADADCRLAAADPDRESLVAPHNPLITAEAAPDLLDDPKLADAWCLADRRIIEAGEPVAAFFSLKVRQKDRASTLCFTTKKTQQNWLEISEFVVVKVKQVAALNPEIRFVIGEAERGTLSRTADGRFELMTDAPDQQVSPEMLEAFFGAELIGKA